MIAYVDSNGVVLGPIVVVDNTPVSSSSSSAASWRNSNGFTSQESVTEDIPDSSALDGMTIGERSNVLKSMVKVMKG